MINKPNITVNTKRETRNRRKMTRRDSFQHVSEMVYNDKTGQYHTKHMLLEVLFVAIMV